VPFTHFGEAAGRLPGSQHGEIDTLSTVAKTVLGVVGRGVSFGVFGSLVRKSTPSTSLVSGGSPWFAVVTE
jgi:hypothetical protein